MLLYDFIGRLQILKWVQGLRLAQTPLTSGEGLMQA